MADIQHNGLGRSPGATIEDCERTWTEICREYVTDAQIVIRLRILPLGQDRPAVIITSPGVDPETGNDRPHVWATADVSRSGVAITYTGLHILLCRAKERMAAHLGGQMEVWDERST